MEESKAWIWILGLIIVAGLILMFFFPSESNCTQLPYTYEAC